MESSGKLKRRGCPVAPFATKSCWSHIEAHTLAMTKTSGLAGSSAVSYFDGAAWVVERSLDNEAVLNEVEGPWTSSPSTPRSEAYRCVQDSGAPVSHGTRVDSTPVGRIPCGAVVTVAERSITDQRQVFLRIVDFNAILMDEKKDTQGINGLSKQAHAAPVS
ncbi:hypothetical protein GQ600_27187 [Phytophthora cactorum]|nr:hypothetical protein GQ600_27187 [Phytophthora cactorum]